MIEIICRENQQEEQEIKLPRNIRQIGSPRGRHKIYMEDYVYTYLKNQAKAGRKSAAVLFGKSCVNKDMRYTFISGAVECGQAVFQFDSVYLDESFWEYIYTEGQAYFPDTVIVGWFVGEQEEGASLSASIESAHRKYFAGRDKVLMLMDAEEDEELFYIYEQGYLQKREGYYIYYEKNVAMQEYMIRKKEEQRQLEPFREYSQREKSQQEEKEAQEIEVEKIEVIEVEKGGKSIDWELLHKEMREEAEREDEVIQSGRETEMAREEVESKREKEESEDAAGKIFVKSNLEEHVSEAEKALQKYRHVMMEKRGHKVERQNKRVLYAAASFFMIAFCIVGITTINNYNKMKEVEQVLYVMKGEKGEAGEQKDKNNLVVQSVASEVTPLEEQQAQQPDTQQSTDQTDVQQPVDTQQQVQQSTAQTDVQQPADTQQPAQQPTDTQQQPTTPQQPVAPQYYTVQAGDTLESICLKIYKDKSKMTALCQANGIQNGNQIQAGQKLILP